MPQILLNAKALAHPFSLREAYEAAGIASGPGLVRRAQTVWAAKRTAFMWCSRQVEALAVVRPAAGGPLVGEDAPKKGIDSGPLAAVLRVGHGPR